MALYTVCVYIPHDCKIFISFFCFSNGSSFAIIMATNLTITKGAMPAALRNWDVRAARKIDVLVVSTGRMPGLMR